MSLIEDCRRFASDPKFIAERMYHEDPMRFMGMNQCRDFVRTIMGGKADDTLVELTTMHLYQLTNPPEPPPPVLPEGQGVW